MAPPSTSVGATTTMDTWDTVGPRLNVLLNLGERNGEESAVSISDVVVADLRVGEEAAWDDFVQSSPSGTVFHLSSWKRTVERALGRQCFSLVARRGNRITGVFPISRTVSRIFGDSMVSMPLA